MKIKLNNDEILSIIMYREEGDDLKFYFSKDENTVEELSDYFDNNCSSISLYENDDNNASSTWNKFSVLSSISLVKNYVYTKMDGTMIESDVLCVTLSMPPLDYVTNRQLFDIKNDILTTNNKLSSLESTLGSADGNISTISSDISDIRESILTTNADIEIIMDAITELAELLSAVEEEVEAEEPTEETEEEVPVEE